MPTHPSPTTPKQEKQFALLLASLVAITPLAVDAYLPAMPNIAAFYNTETSQVALSLSLFLIGFSLGQLFSGPLSDRLGRRPMIISGLSVYIAASMAIVFSASIEQLWLLRILQAMGGGAASVTVGAMVRDRFDGQESAKIFSMISLIMMCAPLLAPGIGALLLAFFTWQSIFVFLAGYAALVLFISYFHLPETNHQRSSAKSMCSVLRGYGSVITHPQAIFYILSLSFAFATMFVFITESAYIYIDHLQLSPQYFPFLFGANIITMMLFNRFNISLLKHYPASHIMRLGIGLQCTATLSFAASVMLDSYHLYSVLPMIMLSVGSLGIIVANATSTILSFFPHNSGTANAVIGTTEFMLAGAVGGVVSALPHYNLLPAALGMAICALCSLSALLLLKVKTAEA